MQPRSAEPLAALRARLGAWRPGSLVAAGALAADAARAHAAEFPGCRLELLTLGTGERAAREALGRLGRFDAAVVSGIDAPEILGRLRDLHATRVCALASDAVDPGSPRARGLSALGFVRSGEPLDSGHVLYLFDIDHYKRTPDWLNARHWAHPERWDKERW